LSASTNRNLISSPASRALVVVVAARSGGLTPAGKAPRPQGKSQRLQKDARMHAAGSLVRVCLLACGCG